MRTRKEERQSERRRRGDFAVLARAIQYNTLDQLHVHMIDRTQQGMYVNHHVDEAVQVRLISKVVMT